MACLFAVEAVMAVTVARGYLPPDPDHPNPSRELLEE